MVARIVILSGCLFTAAAAVAAAGRPPHVPPRQPLESLPMTIDSWRGEKLPDFETTIVQLLGVDDYLNRAYLGGNGRQVSLYVGYFATQQQGDSIHSPLNCLPGSGWLPVSHRYETIAVSGSPPIRVNRYVVRKGGERVVVLYWYQSRSRVVANEYWSKVFMVYDAVRLNRSDAAMIRVLSPVRDDSAAADAQAGADAVEFVKALYPLLGTVLPS